MIIIYVFFQGLSPHGPPRPPGPPPFVNAPRPFQHEGPAEPTPPPPDPAVAERIQKMAAYVVRNGVDFENMMKQKEESNPKFGFLFGGEHYQYYRYVGMLTPLLVVIYPTYQYLDGKVNAVIV